MRTIPIPNSWWCDALTDGSYAALSLDELTLHTHLGDIPTPNGRGPLSLRITTYNDVFRVVGQAQDVDATQEYTDKFGWISAPPGPFGVSGCIYNNNGTLFIATAQSGIGVNGWRYVTPDNVLVTGDATYFSPTLHINQFTILPNGFVVGQNNEGDQPDGLVVVTTDGVKRMIWVGTIGECPRATADAQGNVALAFYTLNNGTNAYIVQTTYSELQALPPLAAPPIPPDPPVPPIPPDPPVPPIPPQPPVGGPMQSDLSISSLGDLTTLTEVPHPAGQGLVGLRTAEGKYKCWWNGEWQSPDRDSMGPWEAFLPYGGVYLARRTDGDIKQAIVGSRIPDNIPTA